MYNLLYGLWPELLREPEVATTMTASKRFFENPDEALSFLSIEFGDSQHKKGTC